MGRRRRRQKKRGWNTGHGQYNATSKGRKKKKWGKE